MGKISRAKPTNVVDAAWSAHHPGAEKVAKQEPIRTRKTVFMGAKIIGFGKKPNGSWTTANQWDAKIRTGFILANLFALCGANCLLIIIGSK
jgi:hypothetical protein